MQTVHTCPILFEHRSIVSRKQVCVLTCYTLVGLVCRPMSSSFSSPYGNIYNRVGSDTFGPSEGKQQCMEMQWHCMFANWKGVAYRIKVFASSWLCVSRVDGTQVLPLVSVPDGTMNLFNLFFGPLLWSVVFSARCVVSSSSALILERKSFREIF